MKTEAVLLVVAILLYAVTLAGAVYFHHRLRTLERSDPDARRAEIAAAKRWKKKPE